MATQNAYYEKLKPVIDEAVKILADGKVQMHEVWTFVFILSDSMRVVLEEVKDLSDTDLTDLKAAATQLYDDYVLPLDIPGPDFIMDPLLRNGVLPGAVEGAFRLAKARLDGANGDSGGGGE
jgi:hypothetical protein